jgi:hypothetical protein
VAFHCLRWSLASQHRKSGGFVHRSDSGFPVGWSHFEGRSLAVARAGCLVWVWLAGFTLRPIHHWRLDYSNQDAVRKILFFNHLVMWKKQDCLEYGNEDAVNLLKIVIAVPQSLESYR